jgi:hypothetical protein
MNLHAGFSGIHTAVGARCHDAGEYRRPSRLSRQLAQDPPLTITPART